MPNYKAKFVVLNHDWPTTHWDFMLEKEASLHTFRLSAPPDSTGTITAEPLPEHRKVYLDYEGPLSGDRGTVQRWDRGDYELLAETATRIEAKLRGERLNGTAVLEREGAGDWRFQFTNEST